MSKATLSKHEENILVAFCLHEKLHFPTVKEIFLQQTAKDKQLQLAEMQRTIELPFANNKSYQSQIEGDKEND